MQIYLVQHAESMSKEEDPERPLTEEGLTNIRKVAEYAKDHLEVGVREILHSGKLRAGQTAEVLAGHLTPPDGIKVVDGLEPMADPAVWVERISVINDDLMLVGHLPHLARLAGQLLCGNESLDVVAFQNAGIVNLAGNPDTGWKLRWMIVPSII